MRKITTMKMPALALVGPDHRIVRSTETFRRRYEGGEKMCESSPELERVLTGEVDVATVNVGDLSVTIEAVTDTAGRRQAMLSLPPVEPCPPPELPLVALRDAADASPAIVWVKDPAGRYLYANPRFAEEFGISDERLQGNTDSDLPEFQTVDGPRLRDAEDSVEESGWLEYTVPAVGGRPALTAFRFALRDAGGTPVATCGVAAHVSETGVARAQAVRLMQLERWNRLDPVDVRAELLEQWRVKTAAPHATAPLPAASISRPTEVPAVHTPAPPPNPATAPAPAAPTLMDTAELLQHDLQLARRWAERAEELRGELVRAQARIREAESDAQQARAAAVRAAEEADRYRCELEEVRLELERTHAEAEAAAALRLSEELRRAVAAERERGDELERKLASLGPRLDGFRDCA